MPQVPHVPAPLVQWDWRSLVAGEASQEPPAAAAIAAQPPERPVLQPSGPSLSTPGVLVEESFEAQAPIAEASPSGQPSTEHRFADQVLSSSSTTDFAAVKRLAAMQVSKGPQPISIMCTQIITVMTS